MYQGFAYVSQNGILKRKDYTDYHQSKDTSCGYHDYDETQSSKVHMKDIGYVEHDGKTNEELKEIL